MPRPRLSRLTRPRTLAAALLCAGALGLCVVNVGAGAGALAAVQAGSVQMGTVQPHSLPDADLRGQGRAGPLRPGPRPPQPQATLTLAQTRALLARAAQVVAALQVGTVRSAPAGAEATLTYRGQPVSAVNLDLRGNVQALATPPTPPVGGPLGQRRGPWAPAPPPAAPAPAAPLTLSAPARARLAAQVRGLYVSGAVRVAGPQVRVTLLSGAVAVAELRFGPGGALRPLSDPVRDGPAGR